MESKLLVQKWFEKWESGDYLNLPITENFKHTSPFGVMEGKANYLDIVKANQDKFLGCQFTIHDALYANQHACVRYTVSSNLYTMEVSEWYYFKNSLIDQVVAYYNIESDIPKDRKLTQP